MTHLGTLPNGVTLSEITDGPTAGWYATACPVCGWSQACRIGTDALNIGNAHQCPTDDVVLVADGPDRLVAHLVERQP